MSNSTDILEHALGYAAKGLPVFPCKPDSKRPYTKHGLKDASTDTKLIKDWWALWPDALIAVPTGERSKCWVLDVDDPAAFEASCKLDLPDTRRVDTDKGYHLYWLWNPDQEVRNSQKTSSGWPFESLPGTDVRGEGGYVIVPPSLHPSGKRYRWHADTETVEPPKALLDIVRKVKPQSAATAPLMVGSTSHYGRTALEGECAKVRSAPNGAQEATLNEAALKIGGLIAGGQIDGVEAEQALTEAGCDMPSYNPKDPWKADDIAAKVERGLKDGARQPRTAAQQDNTAALAAAEALAGAERKSGFCFTPIGKLEYRAPEFIIDGLVETNSLGLIFGDPASGKSFAALDVGLCVAAGTEFHGREVKQGPVFYIAGEGFNGLTRRIAAWQKHHALSGEQLPFYLSNRAAQLLDKASAAEVTQAIAGQGEAPALIVVDTLARNFGSGDENSTKDMTAFVAAVDGLRAAFANSTILIVHHTGHAEKERARGAMALKGALDFEYRVTKADDKVCIVNTKMKDAEPPKALFFELESVELDDASSAVLVASEPPSKGKKLTANQALARKAFIKAAARHGLLNEAGHWVLHLENWRAEFFANHTGDNEESKRRTFNRARESLQKAGLILVESDRYIWADETMSLEVNLERES